MRRVQILSSLCGALLGAGCDAPPARAKEQWPIAASELKVPGSREAGEAVYLKTCIACHAIDGKGNNQTTGANFTAADGPLTQTDAALLDSILNGKTGKIGVMPPHRALLTDDDAKGVLRYLRARFGAKPAP